MVLNVEELIDMAMKTDLNIVTVMLLKKMTIQHLRNHALNLSTKESSRKLEKLLLIVLAQSKSNPLLVGLLIDYRNYLSQALKIKKLGLRFNANQSRQYEEFSVKALQVLDNFKQN